MYYDFKHKNILLIGSASSVFDRERDIDSKYDVIVRLNRGVPTGKEKFIGSRTDVLFLSCNITEEMLREFNSDCVILASPKRWDADKNNFPITYWSTLFYLLNARPSTGIMAFYFLIHMHIKSLGFIGFDFMNTPSWYTNVSRVGPHNYDAECAYFNFMIKETNGKIYRAI